MIDDKKIWDNEKANLDKVVKEIKIQLDAGISAVSNYKKEAIDLQKKMREDVKCTPTSLFDLEDATQIWQYQTEISNQARKYKFSYDKVTKLENMLKSAYFGRIDFIEDGEKNEEKIYIGINNLSKNNTLEILVYDWRAPISGMFYDFETGPSGYECPAGTINGKMLLKRQYKIENTNIVYMFDSSLSINDEMLQELLGKSTDNRMKTIVTSIQREQNAVIRNIQNRTLIVDGPAGSGKTSIALHRAAFILYKYRESIKSENILVFSPNHVFEDYISTVLPELGEENIQRSTFADFFGNIADKKYRIETMTEQMEYILSCNPENIRLSSIKFKASLQFLAVLKKYVQSIENGFGMKFEDIIYNGVLIISAEDIWKLFKNDYSRFPFAKRLEKIQQRLFYLLEQYEQKRVFELKENDLYNVDLSDENNKLFTEQKLNEEFGSIKNGIMQMTSFDIYILYCNLFRDLEFHVESANELGNENFSSIGIYTICGLERGTINYEDLAPIMFLKTMLDTILDAKSIKHVIIDEAQDYTAVQYEIIKKVFGHCNMTILGDMNQAVNGYMNIGSFDTISDIFKMDDAQSIYLTKSYRSSKEISDFCREILISGNNSEQLDRHGNKPQIIKVNKSLMSKKLADDIKMLKSKGNKLIAVICKTAGQCEALYKSLNSYVDISLISNQNELYKGGVVVIPPYLAKGLEFDAVLVNSIEDRDYSKEEDRRLLYTICTRALHELYLYYFDSMSGFVKNMDKNLYINN
ncbi:MAG: RNA polymerase recycling motor HelD [Bacillota bacterium]|nr:RNA polymerase recycling motor HelD [Bacillota bacterium]